MKYKLLQKNRIAAAFGSSAGRQSGQKEPKYMNISAFKPFPKSFKILPEGLWLMGVWAAGGLSLGSPRPQRWGPAGLRGLLKSPPRRAGPGAAALRATRLNPCRGRSWGLGGLD